MQGQLSHPPPSPFTVETDKQSYAVGEHIKVTGNVGKEPLNNSLLWVDVYNPDGKIVLRGGPVEPEPYYKGAFANELDPNESWVNRELFIPRKYVVILTYRNQTIAENSFTIE